MAKGGFGRGKTAEEIAQARQTGNPGGERKEGYLLKHVIIGRSAHIARFKDVDGQMVCSVCQGVL